MRLTAAASIPALNELRPGGEREARGTIRGPRCRREVCSARSARARDMAIFIEVNGSAVRGEKR